MIFEIRVEEVRKHGVITEVSEQRIATRNGSEMKPHFLDMNVGDRRTTSMVVDGHCIKPVAEIDENATEIYSVVRVE
jgi:hypothetical protein